VDIVSVSRCSTATSTCESPSNLFLMIQLSQSCISSIVSVQRIDDLLPVLSMNEPGNSSGWYSSNRQFDRVIFPRSFPPLSSYRNRQPSLSSKYRFFHAVPCSL
jgi:hypothetical protein